MGDLVRPAMIDPTRQKCSLATVGSLTGDEHHLVDGKCTQVVIVTIRVAGDRDKLFLLTV